MLADDAHGVVEAQAEALAGRLGGEEGLEDAVLQLGAECRGRSPRFQPAACRLQGAQVEAQIGRWHFPKASSAFSMRAVQTWLSSLP